MSPLFLETKKRTIQRKMTSPKKGDKKKEEEKEEKKEIKPVVITLKVLNPNGYAPIELEFGTIQAVNLEN